MTYRISAVSASQYVRLRGTNMPTAVPYETDANGNRWLTCTPIKMELLARKI